MKKLLLATAFLIASAAAADAQVSVGIGIGEPGPVYVAPPTYAAQHPPFYYENGRDHHRRNYDWDYWNKDHREDVHHDAHVVDAHAADDHHR